MTTFTPYSALLGGFLIGLAAAMLLFFNGRIAGVSGITSGAFPPWQRDGLWRWCFLAGLIIMPALYQSTGVKIAVQIQTPIPILILAGLLVGYGTRLGNGCTSGHGVCGLSRFSLRSLAATLTFMATAALTVYLTRHVFGMGV
jgi:uncharacterized membrane protein YedE/YeeE